MSDWETCPVCHGQGTLNKPPWVAGDQQEWVASQTGPWPCRVCGGQGIIHLRAIRELHTVEVMADMDLRYKLAAAQEARLEFAVERGALREALHAAEAEADKLRAALQVYLDHEALPSDFGDIARTALSEHRRGNRGDAF